MKNNSLGTKILMALIMMAALAYFGVQAFLYFSDPLTTTLAYSYQVEEGSDLSGYVVRREQVLTDDANGLIQIQKAEGERVSVGGVIATAYADQASFDRQNEINALTAQIEQLQYAQEAALGAEVSLKLDAQIMQSLLSYRQALAEDRLDSAEKRAGELRALVMKRDYTYSDTEDLSTRIEVLNTQLRELRSQAAGSVRQITAPASGLFSAVVDGYETVLTPEILPGLTPSKLAGVQADGAVRSELGKLILGDSWYYAAAMSAAEARELEKADSLSLHFAKSIERDLDVMVDSVGAEENGRVVVVFKGRTHLPELTLLRQQSATVVTRAVEGIRVPKEALRMRTETETDENGAAKEVQVTGVYCVVGKEAVFKPVEVLYNGSGFILVRANGPEGKEKLRLRPGDEVIITAVDLYDGKVLG